MLKSLSSFIHDIRWKKKYQSTEHGQFMPTARIMQYQKSLALPHNHDTDEEQ